MRKIIGFKLPHKVKEIQRRAKRAGLDLEALGLSEPELCLLLEGAARALKPAVLFDTFSQPDADAPALAPVQGLAYSLVLATLGPGFSAEREKARRESPERLPLWELAQQVALEEAVRFATAILEDEAAKESCELSPLSPISEASALGALVRKLDGSKIGVEASGGALTPEATTACGVSWLSKTKARGRK
ncbi:MAG: hypothetical protein KGO96_03070 [Elusimicrobia bacterium]|nr:hypothetical protein [Elusimicrobiota bacterium]MDE2237576.1 hypothetical protein [Elusimicrobiota bacterium]MDE2424874.1 hypothetical protein [Elusimicrobiota bacterium]